MGFESIHLTRYVLDNKIGPQGVASLVEALKVNTKLELIDLRGPELSFFGPLILLFPLNSYSGLGNPLGLNGGKVIGEALRTRSIHITDLNIGGEDFYGPSHRCIHSALFVLIFLFYRKECIRRFRGGDCQCR